MKPILLTASANPENQDRGLVVHDGSRVVLCVADGAGGLSGGAAAANMAVEFVRQNVSRMNNADACAELLRRADESISNAPNAGETTCALAVVTREKLFGASVGDSGVWLISDAGTFMDLTRGQQRRPFIGSGSAWPIPFQHPMQRGLLLLATDGLLKYTAAERIVGTCREHPSDVAAQRLIELVRVASGALPDDVTVVISPLFP